MDWLILTVAVPTIVIPVVLLWGFSGCSIIYNPDNLPDPQPPAKPVGLTATAVALDRVRLTWQYLQPPPESVTFQVQRSGGNPLLPQPPPTADVTQDDTGLDEGTLYLYQVVAIRDSDQVPSEPSDPAAATTLSFQSILTTANLPPNPQGGVDNANDTIVQRINGAALGGSFVRITLRGVVNETTVLTRVTVSTAVPAGAVQPWDSVDQPVPVTFAGAAAVNISGGGTAVSDRISFPVTQGQDLLVAFDVAAASGRILRRSLAGAQAFIGGNRAEAGVMDRSGGYNASNGVVFCIELVEVA